MAGRGVPPEGTPEGLPGGGDDEYRSVVFDESFVRAARLQELSAQERLRDHAQAVRSRPGWSLRASSKPAIALVLLLLIAFSTAIYMGVRHPYVPPATSHPDATQLTVVPLAPQGPVPGGDAEQLFAHSPAAAYRTGGAGISLPPATKTAHFSEAQVMDALLIAKDYLIKSSLDPDVLAGGPVRQIRVLLDPDLMGQFDRSMAAPADDGRHAATGWLVRFDPAKVALADPQIRVQGAMTYSEVGSDALDVSTDYVFVYALRPAGDGPHTTDASLFMVRREVHFRLDSEDLRLDRAEVQASAVEAGPQACSADVAGQLRPLLAGERASARGPVATDPYATGPAPQGLCATLATGAQPTPSAG
ncbi:hypothetical protein [Streptomyces sp. NBC_00083]|uniref:SCO2583 family membrane protein n=1 Tax=Streptomyces sp. NBC_00083 TaxID=2975647 RepID=UPI0022509C93|nr:hypothetical protein [Streptomyces sp. NBC_00083]MCX5382473.1 hypothetical protein [Streptomyces sp. NBC_00083]